MAGMAVRMSSKLGQALRQQRSTAQLLSSGSRGILCTSHTAPSHRPLHTTSPLRARLDSSTIDFAYLPSPTMLEPRTSSASTSYLSDLSRYPLLPDAFGVSHAQPETGDAPLATPEISLMAAHPEDVVPAALTEVEGIGADGLELGFAHAADKEDEGGIIKDLWRGFVDDVFGPPAAKRK